MKALKLKLLKATGYFFLSAILISACTLGDVSDELNNNLTPEEIEAASQIMGHALSDDNDGVLSSLNDAFTAVSMDSFGTNSTTYKESEEDEDEDYSGRGGESNYQYEYDPETGLHTINFERNVSTTNFQKNLSAVLTYIFTDIDGNFIQQPRVNKESIESIDFTALKTGDITNRYRSSEFSRADTFAITGVSNATAILTLDGKHQGNGTFNGVRGNGDTFERSFVNEINFLDIQINKDTVAHYGSLEHGVTGTLNYEMSLYKNNNGDESTKTVTGTIQMDGDGSALLRFRNLDKLFYVNLKSGIVTDDDDDLEAPVASVDATNRTVTLDNDIVVIITPRTEVEGDDGLETLEEVALALEEGINVIAEVDGYKNPQNQLEFIADEIEFELPDDDGDND
ncbi:MAG: hypothetical protein HUJ22_02385 [Gracilimonas sp.]|uniref:hypothetical protein n=1 Tax=Gracilimonas sp. TaxID=1974203 RepID=UPI00199C1D81|nr:hypothetical protein [Gracilimonas sp.]MBD3615393.1 hypothetical protein [Gracilimonas sp.]